MEWGRESTRAHHQAEWTEGHENTLPGNLRWEGMSREKDECGKESKRPRKT